jgi:YihY family inner membrane protein
VARSRPGPAQVDPSEAVADRRGVRVRRYLRAFWDRAYRENITGLAGMVAYNLVLALFPFALLALFILGRVIQSPDVEHSVRNDLQHLFPAVKSQTLHDALHGIRTHSTPIGVAAGLGAIWIGTSFWGAMDTAFCRIYHVQCRGWLEQKRFALAMLLGLMAFLAASVVIPTLESAVGNTADNIPFLAHSQTALNLLLLAAAMLLTFLICCVIYYFVPKGHVPWAGVWPGALFATVTTAAANAIYPFYLAQVSSVGEIGGTVGFVLLALVWFYIVALALMAGAVINALRYELHDTGELTEVQPSPCGS